ncbi:BLOC-3 complex member HPS1-like [Littorina saxatilis]|uniref:Hermansky-Pudlak syndrome 1 n=1 Tax=Littorina saxatilis TaxID=31220 RepID=A0AAN9BRL9_9CAEN
MKCFIAVNQLNNPIFLDFDAEFTRFIRKRAVEFGLQDPNQQSESAEVDTAVVTQLFSPLVLSQVPLDDQVQNPCTSILCPNGFLLVFKKLDDVQYITISGDGEETEDFLQRKILVFIRLTKFLFGPVYSEIANCIPSERAARWTFLRSLMNTWSRMAKSDQSFLVEAVERLHVNQLVSEKCVGLLEKTVHKMQASVHDHPTQHAFLLVNSKLLALYSKRSSFELQSADILLMTLLAQDMFPFRNTLEDLMISIPTYPVHQRHTDTRPPDAAQPDISNDKEERSDENEEFHSAPTTPSQRSPAPATDVESDVAGPVSHLLLATATNTTREETVMEKTEGGREGGGEGDDGGLERLMTPSRPSKDSHGRPESASSEHKGSTTSSSAVETDYPPLSSHTTGDMSAQTAVLFSARQSQVELGLRRNDSPFDGKRSEGSRGTPSDHSSMVPEVGSNLEGRSRSGTEQSMQSSVTQASITSDYWPHAVFLQTRSCQHAPHSLHCAQILPGITLIVVSQMGGYNAADPLCQVLSIVQDLLQGRRNKLGRTQGLHVHDVISDLLRKVHNLAKKIKRRGLENSSGDVLQRWENVEMREKLISYLSQEEREPMHPELESPLMELQRRMKDLFQQLFVLPGRLGGGEGMGEAGREVISRMKVKLQQELMDYRDYLSVKAQRNITMTSYLDDFPGLIHFIYVDRQFQHMTAPSLNMMIDHGKADATRFLKEKIWKMHSYMVKKLQQGYTSVLLREGDFYYSFFLWFEDSMGNPVPVQEPYKPNVETPLPGTLTGSFYKRLRRQCFPHKVEGAIHCYEMFLMHVGLVTPQYIAAHCQKLAHKLWEMSGEAFTPVNLL